MIVRHKRHTCLCLLWGTSASGIHNCCAFHSDTRRSTFATWSTSKRPPPFLWRAAKHWLHKHAPLLVYWISSCTIQPRVCVCIIYNVEQQPTVFKSFHRAKPFAFGALHAHPRTFISQYLCRQIYVCIHTRTIQQAYPSLFFDHPHTHAHTPSDVNSYL